MNLVYNDIMEPLMVDYDVVQPERANRFFLKVPEKPKFKKAPSKKFGNCEFSMTELPMIEACPRAKRDPVDFSALQTWIDNLGPAIYNPIFVLQKQDGSYVPAKDGAHRTRALWEIGEKMVRACLCKVSADTQTAEECEAWREYFRKENRMEHEPSVSHFRKTGWKTRQYYPCITEAVPPLANFMKAGSDGVLLGKHLGTSKSFEEIVDMSESVIMRKAIFNSIKCCYELNKKFVLDVGCSWGWASFLAWELGAKAVMGIDTHRTMVGVYNQIASRRIGPGEGMVRAEEVRLHHLMEATENTFDVVLMLNVFHHILNQYPALAWKTLKTTMNRCKIAFIMTRNFENVYGGQPVESFRAHGFDPEPLFEQGERKFFLLRGGLSG